MPPPSSSSSSSSSPLPFLSTHDDNSTFSCNSKNNHNSPHNNNNNNNNNNSMTSSSSSSSSSTNPLPLPLHLLAATAILSAAAGSFVTVAFLKRRRHRRKRRQRRLLVLDACACCCHCCCSRCSRCSRCIHGSSNHARCGHCDASSCINNENDEGEHDTDTDKINDDDDDGNVVDSLDDAIDNCENDNDSNNDENIDSDHDDDDCLEIFETTPTAATVTTKTTATRPTVTTATPKTTTPLNHHRRDLMGVPVRNHSGRNLTTATTSATATATATKKNDNIHNSLTTESTEATSMDSTANNDEQQQEEGEGEGEGGMIPTTTTSSGSHKLSPLLSIRRNSSLLHNNNHNNNNNNHFYNNNNNNNNMMCSPTTLSPPLPSSSSSAHATTITHSGSSAHHASTHTLAASSSNNSTNTTNASTFASTHVSTHASTLNNNTSTPSSPKVPSSSSSSSSPRRPSKISFEKFHSIDGGGVDVVHDGVVGGNDRYGIRITNSPNNNNNNSSPNNSNNNNNNSSPNNNNNNSSPNNNDRYTGMQHMARQHRLSCFRRSSALRDSMLDSIRDSIRDSLTDANSVDDGGDCGGGDGDDDMENGGLDGDCGGDGVFGNDTLIGTTATAVVKEDQEYIPPPNNNNNNNNNSNGIIQRASCLRRRSSIASALSAAPSKRNSWSSGYYSTTEPDLLFEGEEEFEEEVISNIVNLHESLRLLRRTRAISALANRLMGAPDEATCIEEVTRLMAIMFDVDRVSFAMLTGAEHFTLKRVNVKRKGTMEGEDLVVGGRRRSSDGGGDCDSSSNDANGAQPTTATTTTTTTTTTPQSQQSQRQQLQRPQLRVVGRRRDSDPGDCSSNDAQPTTTTTPPQSQLQQPQLRKQISNATSAVTSYSAGNSFDLEYLDSDFQRPLAGTAAGICAQTLKEHYTPHTAHSTIPTHKIFYTQGFNTVLATPILVNGNKCAGIILLSKQEEDAFIKPDRVLISDIASLLGANIYAKRLRKQTEESNKMSREMLHSFVPPKVLEKIEGYWDKKSDKYHNRNKNESSSSPGNSITRNTSNSTGSLQSTADDKLSRTNSWFVANADWTEADVEKQLSKERHGIEDKIRLIRNMEDETADNVGVIVTTDGVDLVSTSRALYAENVSNVCIIFTDIVGFSRIALDLSPIKVMDMLQDLFSRFDSLCDLHGVLKLETIGDAYLCATNLMEDDEGEEDFVKDAAIRALAMAKDMIREAQTVKIPYHKKMHPSAACETLQIRVGIHVGDMTCGVLGQRLPKFTTCGTAVNIAARMEQTSQPSMIRATKDFHDLVGDAETEWLEKEAIPLKNMGTVETYLLGPISQRMTSESRVHSTPG